MADLRGIEDFVAAVTGRGALERNAYDAATRRMIETRSAQALMDKRLYDAFRAGRQNEIEQALQFAHGPLDFADPQTQRQAFILNPNLNTFAGGLDKLLTTDLRRKALAAAESDPSLSPLNAILATLQGKPVPSVDIDSGVALRGQFSRAPYVDEGIQAVINSRERQKATAGGAGPIREQKIADLTAQGYDRATAAALIDNLLTTRVDQQGNIIRIDERTGRADSVVLGAEEPQPLIPTPPPGGTMMDLADIGTGLIPVASDVFAQAVSLFGFDPDFGPSEAIGRVRSMALQVINSQRLNPRFTEGERKDLLKRFNVEPALLRSPGYLRSQLRALKSVLEVKAQQAEQDAADKGLGSKARADARAAAREARNAIALIGTRPGGLSFGGQLEGMNDLTPAEQEELQRLEERAR